MGSCNHQPLILGGTLTVHLGGGKEVDEILKSLYVDDVILSGNKILEVNQLKITAIKVYGEANYINGIPTSKFQKTMIETMD